MELEVMPEAEIDLCCPACGQAWNVAAVLCGVWWPPAITPAAIAARCWCPYCRAPPPMIAGVRVDLGGIGIRQRGMNELTPAERPRLAAGGSADAVIAL